MARRRKRYEKNFKACVALDAIKERATAAELSKRFGVRVTLIHQWKKRLLEEAATVFDETEKRVEEETVSQAELYEQIARLKVELEWRKKKLPAVAVELRR